MTRSRRSPAKLFIPLYLGLCIAIASFWISSYFRPASIERDSSPDRAWQFTSWRGRLSIAIVDLPELRVFTGKRYPLTAAESFADRGDPFGRSSVYGDHFLFADRGLAGRFWIIPYWHIGLVALLPLLLLGTVLMRRRRRISSSTAHR